MTFNRYAQLGVLAAVLSLTSACAVPVEDFDQVGAVVQAAHSEETVDLIKYTIVDGHDGDQFSGILPCVKIGYDFYATILETGHKAVLFDFSYTSNGETVYVSTYVPVVNMEELGDDPHSPDHVWLQDHIDLDLAIDEGSSVKFESVRLIDTPDQSE